MRIASPQDFWSGILFGALGLFAAIYAATHYQLGTAVRMGPGYFPLWIGGLIALLGLILAVRSLRVEGPPLPPIHLRPILFVVVASIAYGYLLKPLGLVLSTALVVIFAAFGGREFRWREALVLAVVLAAFSVGVFIYALNLPFPLWPEALE
jgi:putative tricarboxylic transport membrane protein